MKVKLFLGLILIGIYSFDSSTDNNGSKEIIEQKMKSQEESWNSGDIEGFMSAYWQSEDLTFVGRKGISKGYQTTLNNYKKSYPDSKSMGKLEFKNKEFIDLNDHFYVLGQWNLYRENDTLSGHYTLIWKMIDNEWLIIKDHSS